MVSPSQYSGRTRFKSLQEFVQILPLNLVIKELYGSLPTSHANLSGIFRMVQQIMNCRDYLIYRIWFHKYSINSVSKKFADIPYCGGDYWFATRQELSQFEWKSGVGIY